ncbi:MAG: FG-GAP repeat protein [Anaerolineae bacterium]|nr:FG-GAP repeat protein [Anaerolineae bacterium]
MNAKVSALKRAALPCLAVTLGIGTALALLTGLGHNPAPVHAAAPAAPTDPTSTGRIPPLGTTTGGWTAAPDQPGIDGLDPNPAWTATGENNGDFFARATAAAGDVNGDGYSDVIVGAYGYPSNTRWGRAYIYHGGPTGLSTTPSVTLTGETSGTNFGLSVATAGDVNGDGYADVIVGATSYLTGTGRAYLYLGSASGLNPTPALTLTGENEGDNFGYGSVATAGDVNGDGYADVVVSAVNYPGGAGDGRVYLYHGSAAGLGATPAFTATGTGAEHLGISAATAGDVNGDGYADVVLGASLYGGANYYGRIYLYYGSSTGLSTTDMMSVTGTSYNERLGTAVSTAGDVNGDGYADVVAGGDYYGGQAGIAYVFQGGPDGLDPTPIFAESDASPHFGRAVGTAGDINGDGYADIVVGTSTYSGFSIRRGRILVYLGSATGVDGDPDWIRDGENNNDRFGASVGTAGDVNGDGFSDLLSGASHYPSNAWQGKAYLYHGGGDIPNLTPVWTTTGENSTDYYGISTAAAGDINGDGYSDAIVGANGYPNNDGWGRAYVYHGTSTGLSITPALTLTGHTVGDRFARYVATAGDVDGDGYADVVIGAGNAMTNTGQAYLYLGSATGLNPTPALTLTGENEGDYFGHVAPAGDVNGDGYADVIISAQNYPGGGVDGRVYLYLGSAGGLDATPALTLTGTGIERLGCALGTAGDVNGDGYADVVVGAKYYDNGRGAIYIYHGSAAGLSATPALTVTGEGSDDRFGGAVSTAGDVNGDGYADVVVGADYFTIAWQEGRAYVYLGGPDGLDPAPVFVATGVFGIDHYGRAVGTAGDVNGDGYADVVISAPDYPANAERGRIYLYLGGPGGPDTSADLIVDGENDDDNFGYSVGTAGDVDGDGFPDLLVSAHSYPGDAGQGKVYLYTNSIGRQVLPRQLRGDGSGTPVQPWGLSHAADGFLLQTTAIAPLGRGDVRLQAEACPPGTPFGDPGCTTYTALAWTDVTTATEGIVLNETLPGLASDTVYRWRARVVHDSPFYPHGPWRRLFGQGLEADLRVGTPPDVAIDKTVYPPIAGPDQMVTYTLVFSNAGSLAAPGVTIVDAVPLTLTNLSYWSSRPVTPTGPFLYTWEVGHLGAGEDGVITITGIVSPDVTGLFSLTNQASIATTAADGNPDNNDALVQHTIDAQAPEPPTLISPPDNTLTSTNPLTLTWAPSPSPDVAGYWLQLGWGIYDVGNVTAYNTGVLPDLLHAWTVAAYDGVGNTGPYTDTWYFTIDTTPPDPPTLLSPADGALISDTTPTMTWLSSPSTDTMGYLLDLNGVVTDVGDVTAYTPPPLADGVYTWTVAAYDGADNTSAYTDTWSFTVDATQPEVVATLPPHGAVHVPLDALVVITFSESIQTDGFEFGVIGPDPGGWSAAWNVLGTVVTLTHDDFAEGALYTGMVATADDLAGNPLLGAPYAWEFTTATTTYQLFLPVVVRGP